MTTNGTSSGPLLAERRAAVLPTRTPDAAWAAVADLIGDTLAALCLEREQGVRAACRRLRPLACYLLTMHRLEDGRLELACGPDFRLTCTFAYGAADSGEELSAPPVEVLGPLDAGTVPALTFYSTGPFNDPFLNSLLDAVNGEGALHVRVVTLEAGPDATTTEAGPDATALPAATDEETHGHRN
jgi:hypothetical protein